jgi:molybdenum cofactor synthesis domain-containing protein
MGDTKKMTMKPFEKLTTREKAMELILETIRPIKRIEEIPLDKVDGRVLAENIDAAFDVPPFDRAAMDGYAVNASDTIGSSNENPVKLRLIGTQHTGELFNGVLGLGECLEISTGVPVPKGSDAVVMVEYTELEGNIVKIFNEVKTGRNIAPAGEDIKKGHRVLDAGEHLTPGKIGALAALGYQKMRVYEKPIIGIYSSGPKIVPQGKELEPGQIYDINSFTLSSIIRRNGCQPAKKGIVSDDKESLKRAIKEASQFDMIIFSGGSSVGSKDLIGEIIQEMGEVIFHGVRVKPGKPTIFGLVFDTPILGMPGYPTSCLINSYVFLTPALRKKASLPPINRRKVIVPMGHRMESKSDREQFITIRLRNEKAYRVYKQSGNITSMTHADGFIILPIGKTLIDEEEQVEVHLLED